LTELLATPDALPASVRDAVFARAQQLSEDAQRALEAASIVPGRIEQWLLGELVDQRLHAIDECVAGGMLRPVEGAYAFRHELAREAIASGLLAATARALHRRALSALESRTRGSLAQLVHHAAAADMDEHVLTYAPKAAREAAAVGAHHQAVAHYRSALRYADRLAAEARADLLAGCAYECYLTGALDDAIECRQATLEIARELDDAGREGDALRWLSRLGWFAGDRTRAERYGDEAIRVLERSGERREGLAWAYSNRAQLCMLVGDVDGARSFGRQALELASDLGSSEIRCHALNNVGTVTYSRLGDPAGRQMLEESLAIALAREYDEHAARAYTNLSSVTCWHRDYSSSAKALDAGIAYCRERDLDTWTDYMLGWRAKLKFELGDWSGARVDAGTIAANENRAVMLRLPAVVTMTRLAVRAGEPDAARDVAAAREIAIPTGESQRVLPVAAAAAELAWYEGNPAAIRSAVLDALSVARKDPAPWETGELLYWLGLTGADRPTGFEIAAPWAALARGDWAAAAEVFAAIGCRFEQALALMRGDRDTRRQAVLVFEQLGATRAANRLRGELREAGERRLPRGPRASTRSNPAGLTRRQLAVLELVADGMTDAQIAGKLHLSTKTVGHHVSAILGKLDVETRQTAVRRAREIGLLDVQNNR
ncbi:MAG TPA: LuxR C-terminal-related transcriptional regulator, partial [Steroidobacteraceae bacterium]|nr:LuxR C-terminal-related transcriptional regulator [Steroidobacteraceae bacterium]